MEDLHGPARFQHDTPRRDPTGSDIAAQSKAWHRSNRTVLAMTIWAGRYEIRGELGGGGHGTVYRVRDLKIGRDLALKLLQHTGDESIVVREAHALTALESPHVLRVFNAGIHRDVPFIATDIAELGSTEDRIADGLGVEPAFAIRWVRQALVGLDYCHRMRVLHRDVTPANIFLSALDHALLGDFGVAVNLDAEDSAPTGGNSKLPRTRSFRWTHDSFIGCVLRRRIALEASHWPMAIRSRQRGGPRSDVSWR